MKLLKSPASPFVRKVMVTLHETGQLDEVELIDVANTPLSPDSAVAAANPVGKIPALIRHDAPTLYDSRVICRFLDQRAKAGLYPDKRLFDTLTLEATADGMLEAAVLIIYEERFRPREQVSMDWIEGQWLKVSRALDALETRWMSHLAGRLDMGQIAIGCALGYLDFRHDARKWRTGHDSLAAWYEGFAQRPAMIATTPHG
ncbi:glutathione S-transferase [Salipiger sp. 1_MG-2023]|uniref:glutathione S-transferase n=1 Tax=Salipiger sp. 1_MG-2023 TaxID=3062665 RepID=UPI0026E31788|nr:glutathione S-transferase [Salipiger sp. 1_MG-2023]MDO6587096.1 glutathione S-transferase [Salipiger sp. 1_MG-2023]